MSADRVRFDELLESVADGQAIDWSSVDARAAGEAERRRVRHLRLVARLTDLHRSLALAEDEELLPQPGEDVEVGIVQRWGHLDVGERVASGAFGDVYRARDPRLGRDVALKILKHGTGAAHSLERLLNEARTLARVPHENVVTVYGADVRDGRAGLWMDYVQGTTLDRWLERHGRMGAVEACGVGLALCRALAAVHAAGLVHGDVKGSNVMREDGGRIVLMDFGAGHILGARGAAAVGSPLYVAPEVLAGGPPTVRSDIYSLGVLLFHVLTGRYPFEPTSLDDLRAAHAGGRRRRLRDLRPELPEKLIAAIEGSLDADPIRRFATAGEMEIGLADAMRSGPLPGNWQFRALAATATAIVLALAAALYSGRTADAAVPTVTVFPFNSDDGSVAAEVLDGLSSEVLRELQRYHLETRRIAPSAPAAARLPELDNQGVDVQLQGFARQDGGADALRIRVIRAGSVVWDRAYPADDAALPGLARTIGADVARSLRSRAASDTRAPRSPSPGAYEAYLRGRTLWEQRTAAALKRSLEYFTHATELDPDYAEAWAGMADVYIAQGVAAFGPLVPNEARRLAKEAALKALERNPFLAEAHTSLAFAAFFHEWDWKAADDRFRKAISLNPQYALARHWYADYLNAMGRQQEAMAEIRRAQQLEPLSLIIDRDIAWHLFFQRRYRESVAHLEQTLARDPEYVAARTLLARALTEGGEHEEALEHLARAAPAMRRGINLSFVAYVEAKRGNHQAALARLAEIRSLPADDYVPPYYLALVHAALGDTGRALDELERANALQDSTIVNVNVDPRFDHLRSDNRFQRLVRRLRLDD